MCSGADKLIGANLSAYGVEGDHGDEKLGNNGVRTHTPVRLVFDSVGQFDAMRPISRS